MQKLYRKAGREPPAKEGTENGTGIVAFPADFLDNLCDPGLVFVFNQPLLRQFSA